MGLGCFPKDPGTRTPCRTQRGWQNTLLKQLWEDDATAAWDVVIPCGVGVATCGRADSRRPWEDDANARRLA